MASAVALFHLSAELVRAVDADRNLIRSRAVRLQERMNSPLQLRKGRLRGL